MTWITIDDAATLAGRSVRTIYNWIEQGRLNATTDARGCMIVHGAQVLDVEPTVRRGRPRGTARPPALRIATRHE